MNPLSLIVPVFNGAAELRRCLDSLGRAAPRDAGIVLLDDASTDPAVAPMLSAFASSRPLARVISVPANGGYVASCNRAAASTNAPSDLLFLNSDTEITTGSIDEMRAALEESGAAVCCPMSNNATFLSVPRYQQSNELPRGWTAEDMAEQVRVAAGDDRIVEIPTPVGFCMLVRRSAWDAWGPFDSAYGWGYGEEDDFGQRAQAAGARLVAATRSFVWHRGGASFGVSDPVRERRRANGQLLLSRWPEYAHRVRAFCQANPFRPMLERLWDALLPAPGRRDRHVVHLVPRWELAGALRDRVLGISRATSDIANHTILVPTPDRGAWLDAIDFEVDAGARVVGLIDFQRRLPAFLGVSPASHVHIHASTEWDTSAFADVARAGGRSVLVSPSGNLDVIECGKWYRA